ncbi:sulfite exporter TauE/SafE family protein [Methanolobus mangrovi]|uniref:Probable membrane transporter protein n=1 Tax=Methanolobus mangrovi TaxID=3072977 RepID=A0AA51YJX9_9EURY|nr:sulfite exporter TauE/SafE family protein [Methanolobus mangrovi]WMW23105.1 sulfite exporter TauE/SafE family protein [Methanolobus mangrovi]
MEIIILALIVFCTSALFSMIGLGGAIFYVPFFYWLSGDFISSVTIALLLNTITSGSAAITYVRKQMVEFKITIPFIIASMTGAQIGAYFTKIVPVSLLLLVFSLLMLFVGEEMIFSRAQVMYREKHIDGNKRYLLIVICGFLIGTVSGMLGIGGGTFIVPLLLILGFNIKRAAASSGFIVLFTSLSAFTAHVSSWEPDLHMVAAVVVASFLGAQLGSHLMHERIKAETLQKMFGTILLIMALRMLSGLL